jgi:hypothetical protein
VTGWRSLVENGGAESGQMGKWGNGEPHERKISLLPIFGSFAFVCVKFVITVQGKDKLEV